MNSAILAHGDNPDGEGGDTVGTRASIEISLLGPHAGMDATDSLQALEKLLKALAELERTEVHGSPRARMTRWTFSGLSLGSVNAVLEPLHISEQSSYTAVERSLELLVNGLAAAEHRPEIPANWTPEVARIAADAVNKLGASVDVGMHLAVPGSGSARVTQRAHQNLRAALKATYESLGSRRGHLGGLNDATSKGGIKAILWTDVGNERIPLECPEELREQLREAWGRDRVEVTGRILENARGQVVRIVVRELDVLPTDPSLGQKDLRGGFWPDMTHGLSARDHLAVIRGEA